MGCVSFYDISAMFIILVDNAAMGDYALFTPYNNVATKLFRLLFMYRSSNLFCQIIRELSQSMNTKI